MNTLSFQVKGWCVTLVTGVFIVAKSKEDKNYFFLIFLVTTIFYVLDSFYLSKERQYRSLYNEVRQYSEEEIDFNMNTKLHNKGTNTWYYCLLSFSTFPLYLIMLAAVFFLMQ
jgi:hypothetical protein